MRRLLLTLLAIPLAGCESHGGAAYLPQEGDVLFQSLPNPLGLDLVDVIEGSTGSPYSHCGVVFRDGGSWKVIEAIGPVKETLLQEFIARGRKQAVWAYRPNGNLQPSIPAALAAMKQDLGKPYDPRYRFDGEAIYCSELVRRGWKAASGKELGQTVTLGSLNWQPYRRVIEKIEGSRQIPLEREMITPRDLARAPELTQVFPSP